VKIIRWLCILPASVGSYIAAQFLGSVLLKLTTGSYLAESLHFLLRWPASFMAGAALVLVAFLVSPGRKLQAAFVVYFLLILSYGGFVVLLLGGIRGGYSPIEGVFEIIGGILGGGGTLYYLKSKRFREWLAEG
jgi:hypothetical protein